MIRKLVNKAPNVVFGLRINRPFSDLPPEKEDGLDLKSVLKEQKGIDFDELDNRAVFEGHERTLFSKQYLKAVDHWKKPLEKKRLRKERKREREAKIVKNSIKKSLLLNSNILSW